MGNLSEWRHRAAEFFERVLRRAGARRATRAESLSLSRLEVAWTATDQGAIVETALAAAPKEGAVLALCRRSTGATRDTLIVLDPLPSGPGDLSYARGLMVTVTSRYWNRAIDALQDAPSGTGLAVLHTHPGRGTPHWSDDDHRADTELATFLYGQSFLSPEAPLLSLLATNTRLRGRSLRLMAGGTVAMRPVERVRTISPERIEISSTPDRVAYDEDDGVPAHADRAIRAFGRDGQRRLADLHVAIVGGGGVGSIVGEHIARWGIGAVSTWDPDVIKKVNINRSAVYTFAHAGRGLFKATVLTAALPALALHRKVRARGYPRDVRGRNELSALLDADVILLLVDDARARHFVNRVAYAHYIPVLDGGNVIRSTAEDDITRETAEVEGGGVRVSHLTPGGPCLWCAGHLTAELLSLAYRPDSDKAADRARGYIEGLGPEHAPSVMPLNALTAALIEVRLQDLLHGLSRRTVPELHYSLLGGTLDELPRLPRAGCRQCQPWTGWADLADLPFAE